MFNNSKHNGATNTRSENEIDDCNEEMKLCRCMDPQYSSNVAYYIN